MTGTIPNRPPTIASIVTTAALLSPIVSLPTIVFDAGKQKAHLVVFDDLDADIRAVGQIHTLHRLAEGRRP